MNTVIIINLDYESFPIVKCRQLWQRIEKAMAVAGFSKSNRLFITNADSGTAFARARDAMQRVERQCRDDDEDIMRCVREFYGIPHFQTSQIVDLVQPSAQEITVDFLSGGSFQKLFPDYA